MMLDYKILKWDITSHCNLRCIHCRSKEFYGHDRKDMLSDLGTNDVLNTIDKLCEAGFRKIIIGGGEPFIRSDILVILTHMHNHGLEISLSTNGTCLDEGSIKAVVRMNLSEILFSMDGAVPETHDFIRGKDGAFDKLNKNIQLFIRYKNNYAKNTKIIISTVLTKYIKNEIDGILELSQKLGVNGIRFAPLFNMGAAKSNEKIISLSHEEVFEVGENIVDRIQDFPTLDVDLLFKTPMLIEYYNKKYNINMQMNYNGCTATIASAYMQPDGAIFPCMRVTDTSEFVKRGFLNMKRLRITENSFDQIWNSVYFKDFYNKVICRDPSLYDVFIPCYRCKYNKKTCNPCPLLCVGKKEAKIELCLIAEKKLNKLR